jgi:hypothetical protein
MAHAWNSGGEPAWSCPVELSGAGAVQAEVQLSQVWSAPSPQHQGQQESGSAVALRGDVKEKDFSSL